jgi:hypothetical protein
MKRPKSITSDMKRGTYPQVLMKSKESIESSLKTYSSKLEYLEEMDKFLHAHNKPKLNQEDIKDLNVLLHAMKLKQ